eukprot:3204138-Prymnesium_polylepis.1
MVCPDKGHGRRARSTAYGREALSSGSRCVTARDDAAFLRSSASVSRLSHLRAQCLAQTTSLLFFHIRIHFHIISMIPCVP